MSDTLVTDVSVSSRPITESPLTERQWVRRGELLEAARRVFERDGYHAATVSSIVQLAGLSQGAFYLYFGDKKAVFAALQEEMATLLRRRIYWATRDESDPARRLEAGLNAYFEFYDEYRNWLRRVTVDGLGIDERFQARQVQARKDRRTQRHIPVRSDRRVLDVEDRRWRGDRIPRRGAEPEHDVDRVDRRLDEYRHRQAQPGAGLHAAKAQGQGRYGAGHEAAGTVGVVTDPRWVGRSYETKPFAVTEQSIRDYMAAVGDLAEDGELIAPPTYAMVYGFDAYWQL